MLQKLSYTEFLELAKNNQRITVYQEIIADKLTPIQIFATLTTNSSNNTLLESGDPDDANSRYSHIFLDPECEIVSNKNVNYLIKNNSKETIGQNIFDLLRSQLKQNNSCSACKITSHLGGAVGFMSYDAIRLIEKIPEHRNDEDNLPEIMFRFYRTIITFDHHQHKCIIATIADTSRELKINYEKAREHIELVISKITAINSNQVINSKEPFLQNKSNINPLENFISSPNDNDFKNLVVRAKEYIQKGDAFQIVLSRRFKKRFIGAPFDIYRALRIINPTAYMFYMEMGDTTLVGASPEKLVSTDNGKVTTNPIAGTCSRGKNPEEDEANAQHLLNNPKENAEHIMLVDLARNDLGKVCKPSSIKIENFRQIRKLSHIMHITSEVTGELLPNKDAFDVLQATFPAGTLSGAPKIRAMEIINELEHTRRNLYGGAFCLIDNRGDLQSSIIIRSAVVQNKIATVQAGAGIVFDSDHDKETIETELKAHGVLAALNLAETGAL